MNESGQVFGAAILNNNGHNDDYGRCCGPTASARHCPFPNGYYWDSALGYQFVNNSGLVVSRLRIANGVPSSL